MSTQDKSAPEPLGKLLWQAHNWFRAAVTTSLGNDNGGVSPAHATLLSQLDPEGMPMAELARRIGVSTPAIHQMVHRLVDLDILEIVPNPSSGRSKLVLLTPKGQTRRQEALEVIAELEAKLAQHIGQRRVSALRDALEQDWTGAI
ncbi:MarR family winged helix-turn-helix transcriptional regulator [Psychromicrobium sp. YIM B11713]|uniref:MarR family winged helix-turn-helix transcriptional regulator n=1 Tax=Psychromicrobium sp. YIM B11713 TaxID=3145233 RepID=UPI00374E673F